jgi:hypothetical protein
MCRWIHGVASADGTMDTGPTRDTKLIGDQPRTALAANGYASRRGGWVRIAWHIVAHLWPSRDRSRPRTRRQAANHPSITPFSGDARWRGAHSM